MTTIEMNEARTCWESNKRWGLCLVPLYQEATAEYYKDEANKRWDIDVWRTQWIDRLFYGDEDEF
jgi:hypothetical protein